MNAVTAEPDISQATQSKSADVVMDGLRHIISRAISIGASDIHIEPQDQSVLIRYRVGSTLQLGTRLPNLTLKTLSLVTKKLAGLVTDDDQTPQEGDFEISLNSRDHVIHLSVMPVVDGEKIVLHLSPKSSQSISLEDIGFWGPGLGIIHKATGHLRGLVVISSTDRSSKSTTILGMVNLLNHPSLRISAIGDPTIDHLHQFGHVKIDSEKGITPSRSLKLLLRQNPDVILITDLVDRKLANAAVEVAAKKLVCVNILAQGVVSIVQRLSHMNLDSTLLASTAQLVSSQTVVRHLCPNCREAYSPNQQTLQKLEVVCEVFDPEKIHNLEQQALKSGLGKEISELSSNKNEISRLWRARNGGCSQCYGSGYRGYITINEVLDLTKPAINKCLSKKGLSLSDIQEVALDNGLIPQPIDGVIKNLRGLVEINDVFDIAIRHGYLTT